MKSRKANTLFMLVGNVGEKNTNIDFFVFGQSTKPRYLILYRMSCEDRNSHRTAPLRSEFQMLVSPIRSIRIVESLAVTLLRKCADFRSSSLGV